MEDHPPGTDAAMAALAAHAGLDLSPERAAAAAAILAAWMPAAHELNRKMSAPAHRSLMPATVFAQVAAPGPVEEAGAAGAAAGEARGPSAAPASTGSRP
ncbi:hypothetical protein NF681_15700 [Comamonadaceae bacterium OTU4NAUVB1]|nr:hypothetical protein NF681_15700 [Comamonadaceae bacterium OTU4NAUVB1]